MIKRILNLTMALSFILMIQGCTKKNLSISYPTEGLYGQNVLSLETNTVLDNTESYSLSAELGKKAELKIVITNLSNANPGQQGPVWFYAEGDGWLISPYENDRQEFISNKAGNLDQYMIFNGQSGSCRVDYYENSTSITNSKLFTW